MDGQGSRPRLVKPKNARAKRALQKRAPRAVEVLKKALLLHGGTTSGVMKSVLADLSSLKKGESLKLSRANDTVRPFETGGEASLEFLARKADCSLFALASHSKKRPHNLVLGRFFDFRLLDMVELGVENYRPLRDFKGHGSRAAQGSKPCLVFSGELFETDTTMRAAKSLLLDFFRGRVVPNVNLKGLDRVVICTAVAGRIYFRQCVTRFRKCGSKVPRVELEEMGPRMDLVVRRLREPPPELRKEAYTQAAPPKRQKNVGVDTLVGTVGRVFVPPQEVDNIALSKPKGVKRDRRATAVQDKVARRAAAAEQEGGDGDGDEAGAVEVRAAGRRKRERTGDDTPQSVGNLLSAGNLVAGKGLKKAPKRSKRAQAEEA